MKPEDSVRNQKKVSTKRSIINAAFILFKEKGYVETTIADIAEKAGISPRSFFSYFESKEMVLFTDIDVIYKELDQLLKARGQFVTAIDTLAEWIVGQVDKFGKQDSKIHDLRRQIVSTKSVLKAREQFCFSKMEILLGREISKDLGLDSSELIPRMAASAAVTAMKTVYDHAWKSPVSKKTQKELIAFKETLVDFLWGAVRGALG